MIHYPEDLSMIHPSWKEGFRVKPDLAALAREQEKAPLGKVTKENVFKFGDSDSPILTDYERKLFMANAMRSSNDDQLKMASPEFWERFQNPIAPVLTPETQVEMWNLIQKYLKPTDSVIVTEDDCNYLCDYWRPKDYDGSVPCDIIMAKTVPLTNFEIVVKFDDEKSDDVKFKFRVILFDGWQATVDTVKTDPDAQGIIGVFMLESFEDTQCYVYMPFVITNGNDTLMYLGSGWHYSKAAKEQGMKNAGATSYMIACLETIMPVAPYLWYGIELSMLNPLTIPVFQKPKTEVYSAPTNNRCVPSGKKRKRQTTYVKKHIIPHGAFEAAMNATVDSDAEDGSRRKYTRRTMAWYVIGHWSHSRNGKRYFVNGYWKGPLRALKKNLDSGRDRKIPVAK